MSNPVRRYVALIQDRIGYGHPGSDPAPPYGPYEPEIFEVVKREDYEALWEAARTVLETADTVVRVPTLIDLKEQVDRWRK